MFKNSVSEVYSEHFSSIGENELLSNCIQSLKKGNPPAMLVVDKAGRYSGVISQKMLRGLNIDASETKVITVMQPAPKVQLSDKLNHAAKYMIQSDIRMLPVMENNKLIGVITGDHVIQGAVLKNWGDEPIDTIATTELITFSPKDTVGKLRATFRDEGISHAPVVKDGKLDGIVSATDVMDFGLSPRFGAHRGDRKDNKIEMSDTPIKNVYMTSVITTKESETIREAYNRMTENDIESLVLVDEERKPLGIVTKQDFLRPIAKMEIEEHPIIMKLVSNDVKIGNLNEQKMYDRFARFIRRHEKFLKQGEMKVSFHKIGSSGKGDYHVRCVMNFWTKAGDMNCQVEGYGVFDMFQEALDKMDQVVQEKKGKKRNR